MHILEVKLCSYEDIEMSEGHYPTYRRYGGGTWEHLIGQSWEPTSPYNEEEKLEALYQQWNNGNFVLSSGWVDRTPLETWLQIKGIDPKGVKLERDNMTDGEVHRRFEHTATSEQFDLSANWYDASTWQPLIDWAIKVSKPDA